MCRSCWEQDGSPTELPKDWELGVALIDWLYHYEETGGPLHVQIDDFNVEGNWEPWQVPPEIGKPYDSEVMAIAEEICEFMTPLPVGQRAAVIAKWEGWF